MSRFFLREWVGGLELTGLAALISQSECPATQSKPQRETPVSLLPPEGVFQHSEHSLPLSKRAVFRLKASASLTVRLCCLFFKEEEFGPFTFSINNLMIY